MTIDIEHVVTGQSLYGCSERPVYAACRNIHKSLNFPISFLSFTNIRNTFCTCNEYISISALLTKYNTRDILRTYNAILNVSSHGRRRREVVFHVLSFRSGV